MAVFMGSFFSFLDLALTDQAKQKDVNLPHPFLRALRG